MDTHFSIGFVIDEATKQSVGLYIKQYETKIVLYASYYDGQKFSEKNLTEWNTVTK